MLSPQTTGVELPGWASGTFHFTFSVLLHLRGTPFSWQSPCPDGPRHAGQSAAAIAEQAAVNTTRAAVRFMTFSDRWVGDRILAPRVEGKPWKVGTNAAFARGDAAILGRR